MSKISNLKKRFTLNKTSRLWLGIIMGVAIGIVLVNDLSSMITYGRFGINFSVIFSLICALLLLFSKEHTESVIIGSAIYAIYNLVNIVINLIKYHGYGYSFSVTNLLPLLFATFIILSLYVPIKPSIIKIVSSVYSTYLAISSLFILNYSAGIVGIIVSFASVIARLIIPLIFIFAKYDDTEECAFANIESSIGSVLTVVLSCAHVILFTGAEVFLEGHTYGNADKYGDYARGLYSSEVATLDSMIPTMWILIAVMVVISIIHKKVSNKNANGSTPSNDNVNTPTVAKPTNTKLSDLTSVLTTVLTTICVIGTIWVSLHYGMYE